MKRTIVINVVGLTESLIGEHTPHLKAFVQKTALAKIVPAFPAVTCTAQSNYLTGKPPAEHGVVANGWYNRELAEVQFWKQSNQIVRGPKIWDELRVIDPKFTCAKLFWWYNMYSTADYSITPRPMYPADGRKFFDIYAWPYSIRPEIKKELGDFPFPTFWGPAAGVKTPQGERDAASRWIANSSKWIENKYQPTLSFVYLPHLDYNLQRIGPDHPDVKYDLEEIDSIVGDLIQFFDNKGVQVIVLSEYGITSVDTPIHLNRIFRAKGWLTIKEELGLELLDCGASKVFAVADHQVAHIYLNEPSLRNEVVMVLENEPGIQRVLIGESKVQVGINNERSGDLIAVSKENAWFTYFYWLDDAVAPDFARCVDIHRKPGYDPVELFLDPNIPAVKLKIAWRLLKKKLGFRMLMNVVPLDATLVKGSHGARPASENNWPVFIGSNAGSDRIESTEVYSKIKAAILG